jgi:hypothetical protein
VLLLIHLRDLRATSSTMKPFGIKVVRETHEAPAAMQGLLTLAAGRNWFGDPIYRFIWGGNRTELIGGRWTDYDPQTGSVIRERFEMRRVLRYSVPYFDENRWYVERYYPPEWFGPKREWLRRTVTNEGFQCIEELGLYPSRGDYVHFYTVEGPKNEFRQLTWPRALWLASVVYTSELAHKRTLKQEKDALKAKEEEQSRRDLEAIEETIPAFNYQPTVTVL